ncbi:MAG: SPASM domain-containing protein [Elusimicrobia bacterium]|nr:SPASM domain-containing protein [Elusimicrobiota bacterium]
MMLEFDWLIHYRCNYRCPYCVFEGMWPEVEKYAVDISVDKWLSAWQRVYSQNGEFRLTITGGEPFEYPSFGVLLKTLSKISLVSFDTNLSCSMDELQAIISQVDPRRIFMGLSFHPTHARLDAFMIKAEYLKRSGIDCRVHFVAYPPHLNRINELKTKFANAGFRFVPIPFRGVFNGLLYPQGYSVQEKSLLYEVTRTLTQQDKIWAEQQIVQVRSQDKWCHAGQYYARVDFDGTVYPCGNDFTKSREKYVVGNILDDSFSLRATPMQCRQDTCPCEFKWIVKETTYNDQKA